MEVNQTYWLDENHPNFKRWEKARKISFQRGKFVLQLVSNFKECKNLNVLDLGSGEGGTSEILSNDNFVISFDINPTRLNRQIKLISNKICGRAEWLPFKKNFFDLIVLQDVLEHLSYNKNTIKDISDLLNDNGIIYLSTPNRISILNIIADPHWGFPVVSLMNRNQIRKYFLRVFRRSEKDRNDLAQLLSLKKIIELFKDGLEMKLNTNFTLNEIFNRNPGIVWSKLHLRLIAFAKLFGLKKIILKISNDRIGFVNNFLTPSFYLIMIKKVKE